MWLRSAASAKVGADDVEEVGRMLAAAGRDCVPRQRNSLVSLQSRSGVEVWEALTISMVWFAFLSWYTRCLMELRFRSAHSA